MLASTSLTSLVVTWFALLMLKPIAQRASLLDIPKGRKQHTGAIPLIGGLAIFIGITVTTLLNLNAEPALTTWLLCSLGIVLLGVADDAEDLPVSLRMAMQILLTTAMCLGTGLQLENLGNLIGLGNIHLGSFGYFLTILVAIGIINAFNMIDGIDGLLGIMTLIALGSLAVLYQRSGHVMELNVTIIFITALLPYLLNNLVVFPFKQKVFMGDAGSMLVGLTLCWLLLEGSQTTATDNTPPAFHPITALWLIAIPVMDMVRVTIARVAKRQSPFAAGRDHLHHILLNAGLSKYQTLAFVSLIGLMMATTGLVAEHLQAHESVLLLGLIGLFILYYLAIAQLENAGKDCLKPWLQGKSLNPSSGTNLPALFNRTVRKIPARFESN